MNRGESGRSSSHRWPERAAFILSFRFRLFTLSLSFFDTAPCGEHGAGESSGADPSAPPFRSSPSSSLGVSARFAPAVLPRGTAQGEEGGAEGGCPVEEPEWEGGRGGGREETVTTAGEELTSACVDTAQDGCVGQGEGSVVEVEGREAVGAPGRGCTGGKGEGRGREGGEGREGEVAMSTSSGEGGLAEVVVDCCSLVERGGAAGEWRGMMGDKVRME